MIKIFRKIRQKMLTENKFTKYLIYAFGEIVLVVIGILIALQVNNWNEQKQIQQSIKGHLVIFKQNLEEDQKQLDQLKSTMTEHVDYAHLAFSQITTEKPVDKWLKKYLLLLIREYTFKPNKNAIDTITQSNEIPYLSEKLRTAVLDYYALISSTREREDISNNSIVLRYEPYVIHNYPVVFQKDTPWEYTQNIYKNDPRQPIPIDTSQFLSDQELEALLITRYYECTQLRDFYTELEQQATNLISLINEEIQ